MYKRRQTRNMIVRTKTEITRRATDESPSRNHYHYRYQQTEATIRRTHWTLQYVVIFTDKRTLVR